MRTTLVVLHASSTHQVSTHQVSTHQVSHVGIGNVKKNKKNISYSSRFGGVGNTSVSEFRSASTGRFCNERKNGKIRPSIGSIRATVVL